MCWRSPFLDKRKVGPHYKFCKLLDMSSSIGWSFFFEIDMTMSGRLIVLTKVPTEGFILFRGVGLIECRVTGCDLVYWGEGFGQRPSNGN